MPSWRTSAGAATGSSEQSSTSRSVFTESASGSGAVAAGTISRSAIGSHSPASPSKGRLTKVCGAPEGLPWQALYRRPEPHGQGCRGPTSPAVVVASDLALIATASFP